MVHSTNTDRDFNWFLSKVRFQLGNKLIPEMSTAGKIMPKLSGLPLRLLPSSFLDASLGTSLLVYFLRGGRTGTPALTASCSALFSSAEATEAAL